jgi:hypothetical protein
MTPDRRGEHRPPRQNNGKFLISYVGEFSHEATIVAG